MEEEKIQEPAQTGTDPIYQFDGKISLKKAAPFGLQHVLAMFVANIAPILIVTGARSAYSFGHGIFYAPAMEAEPGTEKSVKLTGNESVEEVGKILKKAGLIRDARTFTIQAKCYGYEVNAGTYELNTSKDSKELINILKENPDDTAKEDTKS